MARGVSVRSTWARWTTAGGPRNSSRPALVGSPVVRTPEGLPKNSPMDPQALRVPADHRRNLSGGEESRDMLTTHPRHTMWYR